MAEPDYMVVLVTTAGFEPAIGWPGAGRRGVGGPDR